jgi:hypothetical protein
MRIPGAVIQPAINVAFIAAAVSRHFAVVIDRTPEIMFQAAELYEYLARGRRRQWNVVQLLYFNQLNTNLAERE